MKNLIVLSISDQIHHPKHLLVVLFMGAVVGLLVQLLMRSRGFGLIFTILLGLAGGWLGDMFLKKYLSFTSSPIANELISATAGGLIIALVISLIFGSNRGKDRTKWRA